MSQAPWYLNQHHPSLKHQRNLNEAKREGMRDDALKRDETYEGKRDRWAGFEAEEFDAVFERHAKLEEIKKAKAKADAMRKLQGGAGGAGADGGAQEQGKDDEKLDESDVKDVGAKVESRVRSAGGGSSGTVRNLRIREDTAKYLLNLDTESAYYDPKTRSMRADPRPDLPDHLKTFRGDNFTRVTGAAKEMRELQVHAWEANERGVAMDTAGLPSQAELLHKEFKRRKEELERKKETAVTDRYGDAADVMPEELKVVAATEHYVEYDATGRVLRGAEAAKARSKYEEDALEQNHTQVWGSYCRVVDGQIQWGYGCCASTTRNSYCVGESGREAALAADEQMRANLEAARQRKEDGTEAKERAERAAKAKEKEAKRAGWGGEARDVELDKDKLAVALAAEEAKWAGEDGEEADERKRKYNVTHSVDVTEEEMEAYRLKRPRAADPMADPKKGGTDGYDFV